MPIKWKWKSQFVLIENVFLNIATCMHTSAMHNRGERNIHRAERFCVVFKGNKIINNLHINTIYLKLS